jgi:hypothetical protein
MNCRKLFKAHLHYPTYALVPEIRIEPLVRQSTARIA